MNTYATSVQLQDEFNPGRPWHNDLIFLESRFCISFPKTLSLYFRLIFNILVIVKAYHEKNNCWYGLSSDLQHV